VVLVREYFVQDRGQRSEKIVGWLLIAGWRISKECSGSMVLEGLVHAVDDAYSHGGIEGYAGQALNGLVRREKWFICRFVKRYHKS
jgi:hypothetical protein